MRGACLLGASLLLSACGQGGDPANVAAVDLGTVDGQPAPPKRTPDRLDAIPDAFRGRWTSAGDCGEGSTSVLAVARDELRQGDSAARPSYLLRAGARELSMELAGADAGWPATTTLTLLPNGRLRRADPDGTQVLHTRCRANPAA